MRKLLLTMGLTNHVAYSLLGRSIFIRYLEDRKILPPVLLNVLVDRSKTYALFHSLAERFNGDLFPIENDEKNVLQEHLDLLRGFLRGDNLETGQLSLWAFNFEFIPIELISHIYDTFIDDQRESGAYYTPLLLADFVLEETLGDDVVQSDMTCLDPACGSGIFLVGAYRRLVQAWKREHRENPNPETLNHILQKSVFGIDKNAEAVRIAAFSLYLEILNHLTDEQIKNNTFRFPSLKNKNLIASDFFSEEIDQLFANIKFDRIIGNVPWGRGTLTLDTTRWLDKNSFVIGGKQAAPAFMLKAPQFCKADGELAFIAPAKGTILVNSEPHKKFRHTLFSKYSVRAVVNFSAMRHELFEGAVSPIVAIFYNHNSALSNQLIYGIPKPSPISQHTKAIILDTTEIKFLDKEDLFRNPSLWKVAMWGTPRDAALVKRLKSLPTLRDQSIQQGWAIVEGIQINGGDENPAPWLTGMDLIPPDRLRPYFIDMSVCEKVSERVFHRPRTSELIQAPLVLIHRSQCYATFSNTNVAYSEKITGIVAKNKKEWVLKWLVAYMNSPLIKYYHFLTSTSWAVERETIIQWEYEEMPCPIPDENDPRLQQILAYLDNMEFLFKQETSLTFSTNNIVLEEYKSKINSLVYEICGIHPIEKKLMEDMIEYGIGFFDWAKRSKRKSHGEKPVSEPDIDMLEAYAVAFTNTVSSILKIKGLAINATIFKNGAPLAVVSFNIIDKSDTKPVALVTQADAMRAKLRELDSLLLKQQTPSMYMRRHVRIYDGNTVSLVRPSEKRFWTESQARVDADAFISELLS